MYYFQVVTLGILTITNYYILFVICTIPGQLKEHQIRDHNPVDDVIPLCSEEHLINKPKVRYVITDIHTNIYDYINITQEFCSFILFILIKF